MVHDVQRLGRAVKPGKVGRLAGARVLTRRGRHRVGGSCGRTPPFVEFAATDDRRDARSCSGAARQRRVLSTAIPRPRSSTRPETQRRTTTADRYSRSARCRTSVESLAPDNARVGAAGSAYSFDSRKETIGLSSTKVLCVSGLVKRGRQHKQRHMIVRPPRRRRWMRRHTRCRRQCCRRRRAPPAPPDRLHCISHGAGGGKMARMKKRHGR